MPNGILYNEERSQAPFYNVNNFSDSGCTWVYTFSGFTWLPYKADGIIENSQQRLFEQWNHLIKSWIIILEGRKWYKAYPPYHYIQNILMSSESVYPGTISLKKTYEDLSTFS